MSDAAPGLSSRELAALVSAVAPTGAFADERSAAAAVCRVALSSACEPGDSDAALLVAALGARRVLEIVTGDVSADGVRHALADAGAPVIPPARRLSDALARWRSRLPRSAVWAPLERGARIGAVLVTPDSGFWPTSLDDLEHGAPLALWIRGDPQRLAGLGRSVALVGARAASGYGEHVALESAAGLSDRGFAVVSGGAYGVDAAAHRATLASEQLTAAFLAGGVDRLYPAGNDLLLKRIARDGLLLAELPPGSTPTRWRFLMRNRLIAAVSSATVVVEAGARSGSLNTAGHAAQLGRPLGAVPGPVTSKASEGCHRLIREYAAICVTTPDEMAELAEPLGTRLDPLVPPPERETDARVRGLLSSSQGQSLPEVVARTGLDAGTIVASLGRLGVLGEAREAADGWRAGP